MTAATDVAEGTNWRLRAACTDASIPLDAWFDLAEEDKGLEQMAKSICQECPVRADCLEAAMTQGEEYGIFGGMNPLERRRHRRAWLKSKGGRVGVMQARASHGVQRPDPGRERGFARRAENAKAALDKISTSSEEQFPKREIWLQVLDMIIANPQTSMTALAQRLGRSRPWFEGHYRDACREGKKGQVA